MTVKSFHDYGRHFRPFTLFLFHDYRRPHSFYKADASRERSREGSGLGLAIAQKIVEPHQGTIGVASQAGAGTTLIVSLPVT